MKVGRNDPCPCGSGKKYKKCCLAKDEATERQNYVERAVAQRELAQAFDLTPLPEPPPLPELPPPDPLDQARAELWEQFEAAEPPELPALFRRALAEREPLDAELAFEMVCAIRDNHDRAMFAEALHMLCERRPELYAHDAPYYLDWQIGDALATGDLAALPELGAAIAGTAGNDLDTFYMALDKLAYHGQLALAARMMALAWPHVQDAEGLVAWATSEFAQRAMGLTLFAHVERHPDVHSDDPELIAALERFAPVDPAQLARHIALLSGQEERRWSLDDFAFRQRAQGHREHDREEAGDPAVARLDDLSLAFLGALHRQEGVSLAKGDLARRSLIRYIFDRHAGRLKPVDSPFERGRPKGSKRPRIVDRSPAHPLCPDRETLDRFLAQLLHFISPQYYEAAATLELTPAWLCFLDACELLTPEQHTAALADLRKLVADAAPIWQQHTADPTVGANIRRAWEQGYYDY